MKIILRLISVLFFLFISKVIAQPVSRSGGTLTKINGEVFLYGGYTNSTTTTPKGGTVYNTNGCVIGGLWKWDDEKKEWLDKNPSNAPAGRYSHSATVFTKDDTERMLVFFGADGKGGVYSGIWSYNPSSNNWDEMTQSGDTKMSPRFCHSSTILPDGRVLLLGGFDKDFALDGTTWIYAPKTGSWEKKGEFPDMYRYGHRTVFVNNKVQLFGGIGPQDVSNQLWNYDMETDKWELSSGNDLPSEKRNSGICKEQLDEKATPKGRQNHGMVASDKVNKIWILGGDNAGNDGPFKDVWEYNITSKSWTRLNDLPSPRTDFGAALLTDKNDIPTGILIFGGKSKDSTLADTYIYPLTEVGVKEAKIIPNEFKLLQNYPNPVNPSTTISYALPYDSKVKVEIFNVLGQRVDVIVSGVESAGLHSTLWNAGHLTSGVYIIRINATPVNGNANFTKSIKMILMK
jgi:N-acetylneuraminic acid mutarotase